MKRLVYRDTAFKSLVALTVATVFVTSLEADTGLTIYSSAEPGAVPAELYRHRRLECDHRPRSARFCHRS